MKNVRMSPEKNTIGFTLRSIEMLSRTVVSLTAGKCPDVSKSSSGLKNSDLWLISSSRLSAHSSKISCTYECLLKNIQWFHAYRVEQWCQQSQVTLSRCQQISFSFCCNKWLKNVLMSFRKKNTIGFTLRCCLKQWSLACQLTQIFIKKYLVLLPLTGLKIVQMCPKNIRWFHAHKFWNAVSNSDLSLGASLDLSPDCLVLTPSSVCFLQQQVRQKHPRGDKSWAETSWIKTVFTVSVSSWWTQVVFLSV